MAEYLKFTEYNDYEGESWNYFVPVTHENTEKARKLASLVKRFGIRDFEVSEQKFTEEEVSALLALKEGVYMDEYNLCDAIYMDKIEFRDKKNKTTSEEDAEYYSKSDTLPTALISDNTLTGVTPAYTSCHIDVSTDFAVFSNTLEVPQPVLL
jgi:hypothetical protein